MKNTGIVPFSANANYLSKEKTSLLVTWRDDNRLLLDNVGEQSFARKTKVLRTYCKIVNTLQYNSNAERLSTASCVYDDAYITYVGYTKVAAHEASDYIHRTAHNRHKTLLLATLLTFNQHSAVCPQESSMRLKKIVLIPQLPVEVIKLIFIPALKWVTIPRKHIPWIISIVCLYSGHGQDQCIFNLVISAVPIHTRREKVKIRQRN